ncbi:MULTISPECIES: LuxR C-terminal-related transcriptional regulator [unclassified Streptomyces]|uniref:helix-turn-helix transcriptional regulator n=1 Tax=unclassified Streptomyces TaxID=2593676 RepID=UPI00380D6EF8
MSGATHVTAPGVRLRDRAAELAAVARLSAPAGAGTGGILFVTGGPGEGRSALLARAADDFPGAAHRIAAPGHRVPWSGARALFAALAPGAPDARRALRAARGEDGVAAAVSGLLGDLPVLVCLDDLHLWDAHSRAALAATWRRDRAPGRRGPRWLVSAARHHRLPEVPEAETVRLGRLGPEGARALLGDLCGPPPAPPVARRLAEEASGHPGVLVAAVRRLAPAQLAGVVPLPEPPVDGAVLTEVYGGFLEHLPADSRRLLAVVARAGRAGEEGAVTAARRLPGVAVDAVLDGARAARVPVEPLDGLVADGLLRRADGLLRFEDPFLGRAVLASAPASPHRGARPAGAPRPARTASALARSERHRADRLGPPAAVRALTPVVRGRSHLVRGLAALADGPVTDAHEALLRAAELLRDRAPAEASDARFLAMEAAWAGGDVDACLAALGCGGDAGGTERDFLDGLGAALSVRFGEARPALARVVARDGAEDDPRLLLRAGSAALVLGDTAAAARIHARALARARAEHRTALLPRALEHLAYAELRDGRYSRAARTAREGLAAAEPTGQRNVAAHQHAVLALAASVAGDGVAVAEHAGLALGTARPHGLAQAATLAEWALARDELGRGLAAQAAARLAPLVRAGPRGGHFALRMLVVPCFVEAAVASGRADGARAAAGEYAVWAAQGVDGPAPALLARCRALLARGAAGGEDEAAYWFGEAVRRHDGCGNDFERARTLLAYGTWLRRRRRPGAARGPLGDALVTFERAAADGWADRARSELRATGGAGGGTADRTAWGLLTPQQQRIARLAAQGATNREIADRLALSPRTVDHHLRGVFARLGIRSRVELPGVVRPDPAAPAQDGGTEAKGLVSSRARRSAGSS